MRSHGESTGQDFIPCLISTRNSFGARNITIEKRNERILERTKKTMDRPEWVEKALFVDALESRTEKRTHKTKGWGQRRIIKVNSDRNTTGDMDYVYTVWSVYRMICGRFSPWEPIEPHEYPCRKRSIKTWSCCDMNLQTQRFFSESSHILYERVLTTGIKPVILTMLCVAEMTQR